MHNLWYAIRVRSNFEQTTATFLEASGYETFLPTYTAQKQWSDRTRHVQVPLFSGYVFSRFNINNRLPILQAPGVVHIVAFGKTFMPVPDHELEAVRTLVHSPVSIQPWPYLNVGEKILMKKGPLSGLEGILLQVKNQHRLIVSVDMLQRSVAAEVNADWVQPAKQIFIPSARQQAHVRP